MPRKAKKSRSTLASISLGPHSRLYSEDHFINALSPLGMTRIGFRAFCRALSVPAIEVGATRLIDHLSFCIALRAILRVGEPDFLAPGSRTLRKGRRPANTATTLNTASFRKNTTILIAELLAARHLSSFNLDRKSLHDAASKAASRMLLAGIHSLPAASQSAYSSQALATAHNNNSLPADLLRP